MIGLSDVELLTIVEGKVQSTPVARPAPSDHCGYRAPVTLTWVDVDQDGSSDLLLHDLCGAYVVWHPPFPGATPEESSTWLPDDGPYEFVEQTYDSSGRAELATGSATGFRFMLADEPGLPWSSSAAFAVPQPVTYKPKRGIASGIGIHEWLVLGAAEIYSRSTDSSVVAWTTFTQGAAQPPNLLPYDVFDDLALLGAGPCGYSAIGIGRFDIRAGKAPSILTRIDIPSQLPSLLTVRDISEQIDVLALATVAMDATNVVGVLGIEQGESRFFLFEVAACTEAKLLGSVPTSVSTRRPPAPYFGGLLPLDMHQVSLAGYTEGETEIFLTYDGYRAQIYEAKPNAQGEWKIVQTTTELHSDRSDIAFP